jgi:hypothetical protein
MLLDEGLHIRKFEPDHGPRSLSVTHAGNTDTRKLPPLRQLVNERQAYFQNPPHFLCVKQLHFAALSLPFFMVSENSTVIKPH